MDDRRLEHLLRLACEAEDLERSASEPAVRLVGAGAQGRRWLLPVAGVMAAAAAAVAFVTIIMPGIGPSVPNASPIARGPAPTHEISPGNDGFDHPLRPVVNRVGDEEASVVLAFFEGFDGRCTCMHIQDEEWSGDQLATKERGELLDVAYRSNCASTTPKLLVVGIAGKRDTLPRSPEEAEALAAQLSGHTLGSRADLVSHAYAAMPGLSAGSKIVVEAVGTRNAILEQAQFSTR